MPGVAVERSKGKSLPQEQDQQPERKICEEALPPCDVCRFG